MTLTKFYKRAKKKWREFVLMLAVKIRIQLILPSHIKPTYLSIINAQFLHIYQGFSLLADIYKRCKQFCYCSWLNYFVLIYIYDTYLTFPSILWSFDDTNMRNLWAITSTDQLKDGSTFDCDPACIDWGSYLINTHITAALTYARNNN